MQFYTHPLSTYARRVWIALLEKGLDAEHVVLDMQNREHRGEAYMKLNPYHRVPTLVDGDLTLYESAAILDYIEARYPEPSLSPEGLEQRAIMNMYTRLCDAEMAAPTGVIIFPKRFLPVERWDTNAMEAAKKRIERHLAILDQDLEGKKYLVGERLTLADICYIPFTHFLPLMEIEPGPHVASWLAQLESHDSVKQTKPPM